jgi:hypothetical protein
MEKAGVCVNLTEPGDTRSLSTPRTLDGSKAQNPDLEQRRERPILLRDVQPQDQLVHQAKLEASISKEPSAPGAQRLRRARQLDA